MAILETIQGILLAMWIAIVLFLLSGFFFIDDKKKIRVFIVREQSAAIMERLGKFKREVRPGLHWKIPFVDRIAAILNLRVLSLNFSAEHTRTKDEVLVDLNFSVQWRIRNERGMPSAAYYVLSDLQAQIKSMVLDTTRTLIPDTTLDNLFTRKNDIAKEVESKIKTLMDGIFKESPATEAQISAIDIIKVLIEDINPPEAVAEAMNAIEAEKRQTIAAKSRAENERRLKVADAEAMRDAIKTIREDNQGMSEREILAAFLEMQRLETWRTMGAGKTVLIAGGDPITRGIVAGNEATREGQGRAD
ncbi:MAG: hypothetical protein HYS87_01285 [Candidatus Colwellbacteria bacterium]|nr:hypothetical protein [Candidatus Colwellbacteria bacterium]